VIAMKIRNKVYPIN